MVRIPNRYGEEEGRRRDPYSSAGIYVTASVEARCRLIFQNQNMKEEEKIKNTKVNALKRSTRMNQRWELPVLRYHKIMVIYPYPFLVVITQLFSCILFINNGICIFTGSPG